MSAEKAAKEEFINALLSLDRVAASKFLADRKEVLAPEEIMEQIVAPALEVIGNYWASGEASLSQVYMSGKICEDLIDRLFTEGQGARENQPRCAIAVLEDYHSLGKKMVQTVMKASGYSVTDYGSARTVDELVEYVKRDRIEVLLISTLMLPAALRVRILKDKLKAENLNVKVIVGGAPFIFDRKLWKEVGADAMGNTASDAIRIIEALSRKKD